MEPRTGRQARALRMGPWGVFIYQRGPEALVCSPQKREPK